jgi:hypothetical protein
VGIPQPLIGDGKFLAEAINTTYAYPTKAQAIGDQTSPFAYDINFVKPKYTYSPDDENSRFINVVGGAGVEAHYSTMYEILELMEDMDVYIPIKKKIVADNQGTGTLIIALRGTATILQGFMSVGLLLDYTTGTNFAYSAHQTAMDAKYNMLETYFTDPAFTGMTKLFVGHSYGGLSALHLSERFATAYPEQFGGYDAQTQTWSLPGLNDVENLRCFTINPMYIYDDVMKDIEDKCKLSVGYRAGIVNHITRGDAICAPYITHGVGTCLIYEDIPDPTNILMGYTQEETETYLSTGQSSWVEYTHTYPNHALSQYLLQNTASKVVPILLPTINPESSLLRHSDEAISANRALQTRKNFYVNTELADGVPMELNTYDYYDPIDQPGGLFKVGKLHTDGQGNIVDDLTYYNFCLQIHPTDSIRYYHIYDVKDWRLNELDQATGNYVRNPPDATYLQTEFGNVNNAEVKYFTQPLQMINIHDPAQPKHNRITIMRKYHDPAELDVFVANYTTNNALTFFTAPTGDAPEMPGPGSSVLPQGSVLTQPKITFVNQLLTGSTMGIVLEQRKTWYLRTALQNSSRHSIHSLIPHTRLFDMFGVSGKTSFNTYLITKKAYNYETPGWSAREHFIIDGTGSSNTVAAADANDYYGIKSGYPGWWDSADGLSAVSPDSEVWNISYDDTNSSWNITNTHTSNRLVYFNDSSRASNFAHGDQAGSMTIVDTTLQSTDFPLTDTNLQLVNDGNGYFQIYITVRSIKRYLMYIIGDYSSTHHYGYITLIDEGMIDATSKDATLFKIADDVATGSAIP